MRQTGKIGSHTFGLTVSHTARIISSILWRFFGKPRQGRRVTHSLNEARLCHSLRQTRRSFRSDGFLRILNGKQPSPRVPETKRPLHRETNIKPRAEYSATDHRPSFKYIKKKTSFFRISIKKKKERRKAKQTAKTKEHDSGRLESQEAAHEAIRKAAWCQSAL